MAVHQSVGTAALRRGGGRSGWPPTGGHICGTVSSPRAAQHSPWLGLCWMRKQLREPSRGATLSLHPDRGPVPPETTTFGIETWFQKRVWG